MNKKIFLVVILGVSLLLGSCSKNFENTGAKDNKENEVVSSQEVSTGEKNNDTKEKEDSSGEIYIEELTKIEVEGGKLSGILMLPQTEDSLSESVPVVLLVPGSGPVPKNGLVNETFQLAEKLAESNIATLRYDKRGTYDSSGIKVDENTIKVADYVDDIVQILKQLKGDDRFSKVFLLGHSQGGLFGALAIKEEGVDGFISLAGPGRTIDEVTMEQIEKNKANPKEIVDEARVILDSLKKGERVEEVNDVLNPLFRPSLQNYMMDWIRYNPAEVYSELTEVPMLIIQGTHDWNVSVEDAEILSKANPKAKLVLIEKMSHFLKDVNSKDDLMEVMLLANDPDRELNSELVKSIVDFVQE